EIIFDDNEPNKIAKKAYDTITISNSLTLSPALTN
ncbi:hypothetical protein SS7213T_05106, partial [Staphylococcus simiae CCM 7213 = CCUG 51256]